MYEVWINMLNTNKFHDIDFEDFEDFEASLTELQNSWHIQRS